VLSSAKAFEISDIQQEILHWVEENRPSPGETSSVHIWKFWCGRISSRAHTIKLPDTPQE